MNDVPPNPIKPGLMSPGTMLDGRYRLEVLLSEHNGARFWRATDTVLARSVAVHVVASTDSRAQAVLAAARHSAGISEQHFLRVLDCDDVDGVTWVINEWGEGTSLDVMLAQGTLPPMRAAWLAREVAEAIAAAHAKGLVHGRLNPEAVLVTESGTVKIIGFVVNAAFDRPRSPVSPYGAISAREADVVDLAGILYAALTGRWPGVAPSALPPAPREGSRPLRPRQVRAGVPRTLDAICDRVLHKEAAQHVMPIETAHEIAAALSDFVGDPAAVAPVDVPSMHDDPEAPVAPAPPAPPVVAPGVAPLAGEPEASADEPGATGGAAAAAPGAVPGASVPERSAGEPGTTDGTAAAATGVVPGAALGAAPGASVPEPSAAEPGTTDGTAAGAPGAVPATGAAPSPGAAAPPAAAPPAAAPPAAASAAASADAAPEAAALDGAAPVGAESDAPGEADKPRGPTPARMPTPPAAVPDPRVPTDPDATMAAPAPFSPSGIELLEPEEWEPAPPPPPFELPEARPLFASEERRVPPGAPTLPPPDSASWPYEDEPAPYVAPPRRRSRLRIVLVVAMLIGLIAAGYVGYRSATDDPSTPKRPAATPTTSAPPTPVITGSPLPIVAVGDFDPEGDPPEENPKQAPLAIDGKPATGWRTSAYTQADLGGLKSGVGLVLDLGKDRDVGSVQVDLVGVPTSLELWATPPGVTDPPLELADAERKGGLTADNDSAIIRLDANTRTRYLIVWLTGLPKVGDEFRGQIAEITVRS
ncbi:hypothetical protein EFK50_20760 [Nocardioides marmoriginsengisoli]|uniref:non-specific serine/threonine protein kinase n=1 Tax=Nocardioides marmoriginsengisoli TaxID=661483 RepID=A0A3N0CBC5_9ACTN|nr:protein kinase family protein [Nocardioides marmoriginsengisoli]RNL60738.1 hypothetical protein EFK50_20760 [Nocardioides marmoriginsengisoli]